jgi:hypothetical protein
MFSRFGKSLLIALFVSLAILPLAHALEDDGEKKIPLKVPRINSEITLDGNIDEALWQQALKFNIAYEVRPAENIEAPVKTEVFMAYTQTHLLVAFKAYDPNPEEIKANLNDRDDIFEDDWVVIILDTFNDEKRTLDFFCNPLGIQAEGVEANDTDMGWDVIWESAGKIHDWGYGVEMKIPFSSLRFQNSQEPQIWGMDAVRSYPRNVRHHLGSFPRDRNNACYLCQAIKIEGFAGVEAGKNLEITPTVTSLYSQNKPDFPDGDLQENAKESELGITGSWGITNNINLGATINPDFSQIEADAVQLRINRAFALYFQEKRPFFMEGADFFNSRQNLVYTRSMADPVWGTKISGKEGKHTFGGYLVEDDITNLIFPGATRSRSTSLDMKNDAAIFRYKMDYGRRSVVGALYTGREGDDYYNRVVSLDGEHWFTDSDFVRYQFSNSNTLYPDSVVADFDQETGDFSGHNVDILYIHAKRNYSVVGLYKDVSENFRSDLGFNTKADWKVALVELAYAFYPDNPTWWSSFEIDGDIEYFENQQGEKLHNIYNVNFSYNGAYNSNIKAHGEFGKIFFDGSHFDSNSFYITGGFRPYRNMNLAAYVGWGDQIDYGHSRPGTNLHINPYIIWRLNRNMWFRLGYERKRVSVDAGHLYTESLIAFTGVYQFSPRSFFKAQVNYSAGDFNTDLYAWNQEPETRDIFTKLLYSYKISPRTVLFLGYTDNRYGDHSFGITQKDRAVFIKLGYSWNL